MASSGSLTKDVTLVIRANDTTEASLRALESNIGKIGLASLKTGQSFKDIQKSLEGFAKSRDQMEVLSNTIERSKERTTELLSVLTERSNQAGASLGTLGSAAHKLETEIQAVKAETDVMADSLERTSKLNSLAKMREDYAALRKEISETESIRRASNKGSSRAEASIEKLLASQNQLNELIAKTNHLYKDTSLKAEDARLMEEQVAAMKAQAAATEQRVAAVNKLRESMDPLITKQRQLVESQEMLNTAYLRGEVSEHELLSFNAAFEESYAKSAASIKAAAQTHENYIARLKEEEAVAAELARTQERSGRFNDMVGVQSEPTSAQHNARAADLREAFSNKDAADAAVAQNEAKVKSLLDTLYPLETQTRKYNEQLDLLTQAYYRGAISSEKYQEASSLVTQAAQHTGESINKDASEVQRLTEWLNPLEAEMQRLAHSQLTWKRLLDEGKISQETYNKAVKQGEEELGRFASRQTNAPRLRLFGLQGYETQNLMYQINDVVTGLASGQPIMQVIAQQAGQIFQLFQNRLLPVMKEAFASPMVKAFAAGLAVVATEVHHVVTEMTELRAVQGSLALSASGGLYSSAELLKSISQLKYFGASAAEATAAVIMLQKASVSQKLIPDASLVSLRLAQATGAKLSDTTKTVIKGFDGSVTSILKLNDQYGFLSSKQRDAIKDQIEQGHTTEALGMAMDALREKSNEAAETMEHGLGPAFHRLLASLGEVSNHSGATGYFAGVITDIGTMIKQVSLFADKINGLHGLPTIDLAVNVNADKIKSLESEIDRVQKSGGPVHGIMRSLLPHVPIFSSSKDAQESFLQETGNLPALKRELDSLKKERERLLKQEDALRKEQQGSGGIAVDPNSEQGKASAKLREDIAGEVQTGTGNAPSPTESEAGFRKRYIDQQVEKWTGDGIRQGDPRYTRLTAADQEKFVTDIRTHAGQEVNRILEEGARKAAETFVNKVGKAEGTGPNRLGSSAAGYGQFMPQTWLTLYKRLDPHSNLSNEQILAKRDDSTIAKGVLAEAVKEYVKTLKVNGQQVNAANLYLMHFLGSDGIKVLKNADTPMDRLGLRNSIFTQNPTYTHGSDGRVLTGNEMIRTKLMPKMAEGGEDAVTSAQQAIANQQAEAVKRQKEFDTYLDGELDKYREIIDDLEAEKDLTAEGLLNRRKQLAILNEEHAIRQRIASTNASLEKGAPELKVSDEDIRRAAQAAGDAFESQNAAAYTKASRQKYDQPVEQLDKQRTNVTQLIDAYSRLGQAQQVSQLDVQLTDINKKLAQASSEALDFYEGIKKAGTAAENGLSDDQLDGLIAKLQMTKTAGSEVGKEFLLTGRQINEDFAGGISSAMGGFLTSLAQGKGLVSALATSFGQFFSGFLMQIGQAILKQELFNSLSARSGSSGASGAGGFGGWISKIVGLAGSAFGGFGGEGEAVSSAASSAAPASYGMASSSSLTGMRAFHTGGILGSPSGMTKTATLGMFANAPKFHDGGVLGETAPPLAHDELPIIGKVGEEMLTENDPRHSKNLGKNAGNSAQSAVIKNVLVQNPKDLANALAGSHGQRLVLTHLSNNVQESRQILGIS